MGAPALTLHRGEDPFRMADEEYPRLREFLQSEEARTLSHSDVERELEVRSRPLLRALLQAWIDQQAEAEVEGAVVDAKGEERRRKRTQSRALETIFGTVSVERTGYGAEGEASLHPVDAELNLPEERYSLELRRRAALEASKGSFEETVETLSRYTGAEVAKRQVEELSQRAAQDFDAFYEERRLEAVADYEGAAPVLVITSDGKGVALHKDDLRAATRKAAHTKGRRKLRTRLSKGEKRGRKRMATVASVYTVEPYRRTAEEVLTALAGEEQPAQQRPARPRPQHKRVWASLEKEVWDVLEEAFHEAFDRDVDQQKTWVAVVDGNETQLDILETLAEHYNVQLTIVLDLFHVLEYLWKAGHAFHAEGSPQLEDWVFQRLKRILEGGASQVAAGMRRSATKRKLAKQQRAPVDTCANYLLKYKKYLAYDHYLTAGLPIASGVIEGACRHLVKDRLGITGARWRLTGAEAVLRLRALRTSGDFEEYWRFHEAQELERNHRSRYGNQELPSLLHPKPFRPKIIP